jgi:hypothetical protein
MYVVFVLQCQKGKNNRQILFKEQEQSLYDVLYHVALILLPLLTVHSAPIGYQKSFIRFKTKQH